MAKTGNIEQREQESYVDTQNLRSIKITLSTASTVTTISLPSSAKGIKIYSSVDDVRFAVNDTVAAIGTSASTTIASSAFTVGGVALSGIWETRLLQSPVKTKQSDVERTLTLVSLANSTVLTLETF